MVKIGSRVRLLGLLLLLSVQMHAGNLLTNGGFEAGDLTPWLLSTTLGGPPDFNCLVDTTTVYCSGPLEPSQTPSNYIGAGNWGIFLGYPGSDDTPAATLVQLVPLSAGAYLFSSMWGQHWTYTDETPEGILEFVYGTSLASLTAVTISSDPSTTVQVGPGSIFSQAFTIPSADNYYVGFRFYNVMGEWAVDNACLETREGANGCNPVPEPSTLGLLALPIAALGVALKARKAVR